MKINICICDDEKSQTDLLHMLVKKWANENNKTIAVSVFHNAESFLFHYEDDKSQDILLLDIQMDALSGVDLAKLLRKENGFVQIIFITALPEFIAEGYEVSALHYLIKPVKEDKLFGVLDKAAERLKKSEETLLVHTSDETIKILLSDIIFIESFAHYIHIQTKKGKLETRTNIGEMERLLGDAFIRCHRSYIAGLRHISRITKTEVIFDNRNKIPLSRRLYTDVNLAFITYHKGGK